MRIEGSWMCRQLDRSQCTPWNQFSQQHILLCVGSVLHQATVELVFAGMEIQIAFAGLEIQIDELETRGVSNVVPLCGEAPLTGCCHQSPSI